jgi:hypothetical protein
MISWLYKNTTNASLLLDVCGISLAEPVVVFKFHDIAAMLRSTYDWSNKSAPGVEARTPGHLQTLDLLHFFQFFLFLRVLKLKCVIWAGKNPQNFAFIADFFFLQKVTCLQIFKSFFSELLIKLNVFHSE